MNKYHAFENETDQEPCANVAEPECLDASLSKAAMNGSSPKVPKSISVGQSRFVESIESNGDNHVAVIISDPAEVEIVNGDVG